MKTFVRERYDRPDRQDDRWIRQSIFRLFISVEERTNVVILNYLWILVTVQNVLSFLAFYKRKERIFVTFEFFMFDKRNTQYETPLSTFVIIQWRIQGGGSGGSGSPPHPLSDLTLVWDWNSYIDRIVYHFLTGWLYFVLVTLLWSVSPCSQSSITRANGNRRSQIEKHVVVSAFSAGRQLCILYEHGKGTRNYNVQPRLVGRGVGEK